jgi:hypothetical protein
MLTIAQIFSLFIALATTAYLGFKLRFGSGTPWLCLVWAATVVACVIAFAGIR